MLLLLERSPNGEVRPTGTRCPPIVPRSILPVNRFDDLGAEEDRFSRDWKETRRILGRIGRQEPAQRTRIPRLVNDLLLAMSAVQIGATLFTCNGEEFRLIARDKKLPLQILRSPEFPAKAVGFCSRG